MRHLSMRHFVLLGLLFLACHASLAHAGGGTVTVMNRTVVPLRIADQQDFVLATVAPARSGVFSAPPGRHTFRALRLDGSLYLEATVVVNTRATVVWDILPTEAVLEIRNQTTKHVTVEIDGQPLAEVKPGATTRLDGIRAGSRQLTAHSEGVLVASTVAQLVKQDTYLWSLGQPGNPDVGIPILRVRNFSGRAVSLRVDGQPRIEISPADSAALVGVNPGEVKVEARALSTGAVVASETLSLIRGQTRVWDVVGPEGRRAAVEVRNTTARHLKVCVDGAFCLRIGPKRTTRYDSLAPGQHTFHAYDLATDRLIEALEAELATEVPYEWTVGATD